MSLRTNSSVVDDSRGLGTRSTGERHSPAHPAGPRPLSTVAPAMTKPVAAWKTAVLCLLAFVLVLYNALSLAVMIYLTPKNDFGRTFCSIVAFVHGEEMYGMNPSIPWELEEGTVIDLWNLNPPHFHLLLLPLAWLPVGLALILWLLANIVCGYFALRLILRETQLTFTIEQRQLAVLGVLCFIGTSSALVTGHMSFLLFWMVTLCWHAARHERWTAAGVWLGIALSLKPFLLFLAPYFLWRRQWRGLMAMGSAVLLCLTAGLVVFGVENHSAWYHTLQGADTWAWLPMNASVLGFLTRVFTDNPMFTPVATSAPQEMRTLWLAIGIPMGLLTYAAVFRDSSRAGVDRAFALLLVGSLLLSPLGWSYYFWLAAGPMAALLTNGRRGAAHVSPWTRKLLIASLFGLMYPLFCMRAFQQTRLETVLTNSVYFWGLLLVWFALLADAWQVFAKRGTAVES